MYPRKDVPSSGSALLWPPRRVTPGQREATPPAAAPGAGWGGWGGGCKCPAPRCPGGVKLDRGVRLRPVRSACERPSKSPLSSLLQRRGTGSCGERGEAAPVTASQRKPGPAAASIGGSASLVHPDPRQRALAAPREHFVVSKPTTNKRTTTPPNPANQTANEASVPKGCLALRGSPPGPAPRREQLPVPAAPGSGGPGAPSHRPEGSGPARHRARARSRPRRGNRPGRGGFAGSCRRVRAVGFGFARQPSRCRGSDLFWDTETDTHAHTDTQTHTHTDTHTWRCGPRPPPLPRSSPRGGRGAGRYLRARAAGVGLIRAGAARSRSGAAPGRPGLRAVRRAQDNGREEGAGEGGGRRGGDGAARRRSPPPVPLAPPPRVWRKPGAGLKETASYRRPGLVAAAPRPRTARRCRRQAPGPAPARPIPSLPAAPCR